MGEMEFRIERLILKTGNRLNSSRDDDLRSRGLTPAQSETLLFFREHDGATVSELKDHLQVSHQAARNIVARLQDKGLLHSTASSSDGRAREVRLTDRGTVIVESLLEAGTTAGDVLLRGFSEREKRQLLAFVERAFC